MKRLRGISLSPGFGSGRALVHRYRPLLSAPRSRLDHQELPAEVKRFERALETSIRELHDLKARVVEELGDAEAAIFDAHLALVQDGQFVEGVKRRLGEEMINVEHAVAAQISEMEKLLASIEDEYLQERHRDVRDIGNRILKNLNQSGDPSGGLFSPLSEDTVLVAHELLPSHVLELDREHIKGIVTEVGGEQSHTAILARSLGVPLVTGVEGLRKTVSPGDYLLVDGKEGTVTIAPSADCTARHRKIESDYRNRLRQHSALTGCTTRDGTAIRLLGNIGRVPEADDIDKYHLEGVGLFRSEYLFMNSVSPPGSEEQGRLYARLLERARGRPVVVRTLDLGGDKHPAFLRGAKEENPGLSLRGLQFSLAHRTLFRTQLRSLAWAAKRGRIKIMFPMVVSVDDLAEGIEEVNRAARNEGLASRPEVGAMIETPAAVLMIEEILGLVDFVSIGTNDLTQFTLAADRGSLGMLRQYAGLHPALFRAIQQVTTAAKSCRKPCAVCGELAGDSFGAALLAGLGVRHLSMSPVRAVEVRHALHSLSLNELESAAAAALSSQSRDEIAAIVSALFQPLDQPSISVS